MTETSIQINTLEFSSKKEAIDYYTPLGFEINFSDNDTIQFIKKKRMNRKWALLWILCIIIFGIGLLFLLIQFVLYLTSKDEIKTVTIKP